MTAWPKSTWNGGGVHWLILACLFPNRSRLYGYAADRLREKLKLKRLPVGWPDRLWKLVDRLWRKYHPGIGPENDLWEAPGPELRRRAEARARSMAG
jgi:hypothetical protein